MWDYSDEVRKHYLHPQNVGEVNNPDGYGEVGNIKCGDALRLTFKLDDNGNIEEIKFKTFGCGSAIASSSILTELCKGKSLTEASKITNKDIAEALGGLPTAKMHCSVMGQEALEKAIAFYKSGGKVEEVKKSEGTVVCNCFNVTDVDIENAIKQNELTTVEEVTNFTKAGGGCGGCVPQIEEILSKVNGTSMPKKIEETKPLTTVEKIDLIRKVLAEEVRPILKKDGGDCELVDLNGNVAIIRFLGHCKGCTMATVTKDNVVEKILKKKVSPDITVQQAP